MTEPKYSAIPGSQNIFLAPRSNETAYKNFMSSMEGKPRDEITGYLSDEDIQSLGSDQKFFVWGCQPSLKGRWDKLEHGDYIMFYARGVFIAVGRLKFKTQNEQLAKSLWPVNKDTNEPWSCLFFVEDLVKTSISLERFNEMTNYKLKMVQGFMPVSSALSHITRDYGTVDNFMQQLMSDITIDQAVELSQLSKTSVKDMDNEAISRWDTLTRDREPEEIKAALLRHEETGRDKTPQQRTRIVKFYERNSKLVKDIKDKYRNECQICGFTFEKARGGRYSEAAHVVGIHTGKKGVDVPDNIWVLCANHHKMLDLGAIQAVLPSHYIEGGVKRRLLVS